MPAKTKVPQKIYVWEDESGITHFSNVDKQETNTLALPATSSPFPQQSQNQEKSTEQAIQPQVAKPAVQPSIVDPRPAANGRNVNGSGFIVFMFVVVVAFRLFLNSVEKERRKRKRFEKVRELRPEANPIPAQEVNDIESEIIRPELNPMPSQPSWTLDFIKSLEWREFEKLCARVLETRGFHAKLGNMGADGGTDIHIYTPHELEKPYAIAQCKAYRQEIKVDVVRAFRGVMAANNITKGFFFTSGKFYKKAAEFGKEQQMELVTGDGLLAEITRLPQEKQEIMLKEIISTDYTTPTCVTCGIKMTRRNTPKSDYQFWGCINYPRCKNKMELRWTDQKKNEHPIKTIARRSINRWL